MALALITSVAVPARADGPAPTQSQSNCEVRFMTNMIDHHFKAVQMAQLCQDRAVHEELLSLCGQIETAQQQEIAEMQASSAITDRGAPTRPSRLAGHGCDTRDRAQPWPDARKTSA